MKQLFQRADILIPSAAVDLTRWSVIACDQHTSEPEYWNQINRFVGNSPSTLRMILPEAYLGTEKQSESDRIPQTMSHYLETGVFQTLKESYIYTERTLSSGAVRKGLIGVIDLDEYSYSSDSKSLIRATEGTVEERLPPRVAIRLRASLELPHVMVFINDPEDLLFRTCSEISEKQKESKIYDFELSSRGGHITGYRFYEKNADTIDSVLEKITSECLSSLSVTSPAVLAIGDGNHSLAAAKKCGDRFALVELVNIHDPAISFEPIHRVLFQTDVSGMEKEALASGLSVIDYTSSAEGGKVLHLSCRGSYSEFISSVEKFCKDYLSRHGGTMDYIHNDETAIALGSSQRCAAILLPALQKTELFFSITAHGTYPKKSFSIGHSDDKRYYLECRLR